jgi:hypothetical protein
MFIPPGITSSGTRNSPEQWDTTEKYHLIYTHSNRWDQNAGKIFQTLTIPGSAANANIFLKFKYENLIKIKNKPDPALFGTSYLS